MASPAVLYRPNIQWSSRAQASAVFLAKARYVNLHRNWLHLLAPGPRQRLPMQHAHSGLPEADQSPANTLSSAGILPIRTHPETIMESRISSHSEIHPSDESDVHRANGMSNGVQHTDDCARQGSAEQTHSGLDERENLFGKKRQRESSKFALPSSYSAPRLTDSLSRQQSQGLASIVYRPFTAGNMTDHRHKIIFLVVGVKRLCCFSKAVKLNDLDWWEAVPESVRCFQSLDLASI